MSGEPDPKSRSLARGERRYRRKVASPMQWQAIVAAKRGPCRVCGLADTDPGSLTLRGWIEYHHLITRGVLGDDVADNIVPLHHVCHGCITDRVPSALRKLAASLTDSEYAYIVGKLGEGGMERLFGAGVSARTDTR